ncbi:MAG: DNA recombination protein RmuC [Gammaproteobacteria bacterium]|nr:DNA recombination protein RmuC [Gammaproteobacteria bacterium]
MAESVVWGALFLALITGAMLGAWLVWSKMSVAAKQQQLDASQQQSARLAEVQGELQRQQTALAVADERVVSMGRQLQQAQQERRLSQQQLDEVQQRNGTLQAENTELHTRQQEKELHYASQVAQFEQQKLELSREFENLANRIFEAKGKSFSESSRQSLDDMLKPFRQQIVDFRQKVEEIHHKDTEQQAQLRSELGHLKELNKQITEEAHQLATALKGQKKSQGNWGELVLENVLDRSGLVIDKDYKREVSFNTESGRQRPDVIIYLPENKHLIVDAKVSLNAYTRYVNSENEAESKQAMKAHVAAISDRIKELSDRHYFELPGLNSPEMVFMFIPIESAFVEALRADESLFQKALEQNVLVATPTTLLTSLNIVRQLWRFEDQNRHTAELAEKAGRMYDKFNTFLGSMEKVGRSLDSAKDSYEKAFGQLYSGRGNLIKQANELKKLGVSVKAELPALLVERAELELDHSAVDAVGESEKT